VFDLAVLRDDALHLVLQEPLQEEVGQQDVHALLLLLQFLTHRAHHHLLQLASPLLAADRRLLPPAQSVV
jgi:hypothetical protein